MLFATITFNWSNLLDMELIFKFPITNFLKFLLLIFFKQLKMLDFSTLTSLLLLSALMKLCCETELDLKKDNYSNNL